MQNCLCNLNTLSYCHAGIGLQNCTFKKQHLDLGHMGSNVVFGALQQDVGLWHVGGVCTVRHYTRNCAGCRLKGQKRGKQLMAPLPASRLKPRTHVFAHATSDLAGPFSVTVGRSSAKHWICLFVCMVATAIRIEVSVDLTASTFINVFQTFLCSTGFRTKFLRTDNATNFCWSEQPSLTRNKSSFISKACFRGITIKMEEWEIQWEFSPPEASHRGGLYERKIQNIHNALHGLFLPYHRNPSDDEFLTCMKMVEYINNCRPLTRSVFEDGLPPLRPIDLMVGALDPTTECSYPLVTEPGDELCRGHRYTKKIAELWWER